LRHHTKYNPRSRVLAQGSQPDNYFANEARRHDGLEKHYRYDANGELIKRADTRFFR
jgi:hypothetical protein